MAKNKPASTDVATVAAPTAPAKVAPKAPKEPKPAKVEQIIERPVAANKANPVKAKKVKSAGKRALELVSDTHGFQSDGAQRTEALVWANLEAAAATDRQTAILEQIARDQRTQVQLQFYALPASAYPEGVRDQIKPKIGIAVSADTSDPTDSGPETL